MARLSEWLDSLADAGLPTRLGRPTTQWKPPTRRTKEEEQTPGVYGVVSQGLTMS